MFGFSLNVDKTAIYTFGQPKVGCENFLGSLQPLRSSRKLFRFVNDDDGIARMPKGFVYTHGDVGHLCFIDSHNRLRWGKALTFFQDNCFCLSGSDALTEHAMVLYAAALDAYFRIDVMFFPDDARQLD